MCGRSPARLLARIPLPRLAGGALALVFLLTLPAAGSPEERRPPPPEESFTFDIKFLWFDRAAVGRLELRRIPGRGAYRAELRAQTRGVIGFFTRRQKNVYESLLRWSSSEGRLTSLGYRKEVIVGEESWTSDTRLDYGSRLMVWTSHKNGRVTDEGREAIPPGTVYEDILSAFFNLRGGAYGPIEKGRFIRLQTVPTRERDVRGEAVASSEFIRSFEVQIADPAVESRYRKMFGRVGERGYLVFVKVPKEIFGQKTGEVRIWLNPELVPMEATVEDAIFFGDVTGVLRGHAKMPPTLVGPEGVSD